MSSTIQVHVKISRALDLRKKHFGTGSVDELDGFFLEYSAR